MFVSFSDYMLTINWHCTWISAGWVSGWSLISVSQGPLRERESSSLWLPFGFMVSCACFNYRYLKSNFHSGNNSLWFLPFSELQRPWIALLLSGAIEWWWLRQLRLLQTSPKTHLQPGWSCWWWRISGSAPLQRTSQTPSPWWSAGFPGPGPCCRGDSPGRWCSASAGRRRTPSLAPLRPL